MKIGDLVKGKYVKKDQYGVVIKVTAHKQLDVVMVSWDCGNIKWFLVENLETVS